MRAWRPPGALAALVGATVLLGFAWALWMPGGQSPDEPAHLAYVQVLAERLDVPRGDRKVDDPDARDQGFSTEQRLAREGSHQQWQYAEPRVKSEWDPAAERRWLEQTERLGPDARSDGGGPNSAAGNPPLYYAYEALAYRAAGGHFFDRLFLMRMWSALLLAGAVAATWLLAGELGGRDRLFQLVSAGVVGLQPMASFISASVNPDAGLIPLWALAFWLGARILRRGPSRAEVAGLLAVATAALAVKPSSLALLPAVAFVLVVATRRELGRRPLGRGRLALLGGAILVALAVVVAATSSRLRPALVLDPREIPGFLSYMWQAYLPNLPGQTAIPGLAAFAGFDIWIRTGWAAFGWLEIQFREPVYYLLAVASVAAVGGGLVAVWRGRLAVSRDVLAFFAIAAVVLVGGLHWGEYNQFVRQQQSFIQGRYWLPLLPLGGLLTAGALRLLPAGRRAAAAGAVLGGLLVLQLFSLGLVAVRFYV